MDKASKAAEGNPKQTKQILITGGCGYIGNQLVTACLNLGHQVWNLDLAWFGNPLDAHPNLINIQADIRNINQLKLPNNFDVIYHLANIANDPCGLLDGRLTWEVNALASQQLAEFALNHGQPKFIYASSGSVYGVKSEPKVTEDCSLKPISDYNKSKMISERVLISYANELPLYLVRPASVCGYSKRMRLDLAVNMLTIQGLTKKLLRVLGGEQVRPHIHIGDLIQVYLQIGLGDQIPTGIYNAGFENMSILTLAKKIQTHLGDVEIGIEPSNDPRSYRICSDKLLATGFKPKFGVDFAISELSQVYESGALHDLDECYNLKTMKKNIEKQANAAPSESWAFN